MSVLTPIQIKQLVSSNEEILSSIDRAMDSVGGVARNLVYWHLKRFSDLKRADIPENPMLFVRGLRTIYGDSSPGIERAIAGEINAAFNLSYCLESDLAAVIFQARSKLPSL